MTCKTYFRFPAAAILLVLVIVLAATISGVSADDAENQTSKTEANYPNLGSALNQMVSNVRDGRATAQEAAGGAALFSDESVAVTIHLSGHVNEVVSFLQENGGDPRNVGVDYIEAYVPVSLLGPVSERPGVIRVRQIFPPQPTQLAQQVIGNGPAVHGTQAWNRAGYSGQGVKVGVIDLSFRDVTTLVGTELPANIVARCYSDVGVFTNDLNDCEPSGGTPPTALPGCSPETPSPGGHGTIVAESLLDMAPGVTLYVADPYSRGDLLETVEWMGSQGVQVINYSVGYFFDGPGDGTSPSSVSPLNTVDRAVQNDILWVSSAGNSAQETWFGDYSDSDDDKFLEFGGAIEELIELPLYACEWSTVQLRWEDSWTGARTDLDLHLYKKSTGEIIFSSDDSQFGQRGQVPWEGLRTYRPFNTDDYGIKIEHFGGEVPDWVQVTAWTVYPIQPHTLNGSINNPSESANPGLLAVGAAPWFNVNKTEPFSSRGPTPDGRTKPEIVSADCGATAFASLSYSSRLGGNCGFAGTSQAAPHVSGMAALVRQRFPDFTAEQAALYLKLRAEARGTVPNNTWGYGFAKLPPQDALPSADVASIFADSGQCGQTINADETITGAWASNCQSTVEDRGYARYYSFTLEQEGEVTIDLESRVDTYLYLREGDSRNGTILHENDDVEPGGVNLNSRIVARLSAGTYTIEATTFSSGQAGAFNLTLTVSEASEVTDDSPVDGAQPATQCGQSITANETITGTWAFTCQSMVEDRGYTRYYSFSLEQEGEVTIDLESEVDTYLYLRSGNATTGTILHENDDVEPGGVNLNSRISETLATGSYTIEATTFSANQAGSFTLTISSLESGDGGEIATQPGECSSTIDGAGSIEGTWVSECQSTVDDRGYARYYTFALAQQSQVTIELTSTVDPYLYLRAGNSWSGTILHENDDVDVGRSNLNSRISEELAVGSYTIEATTYGAGETGDFTLTITFGSSGESNQGGIETVTPREGEVALSSFVGQPGSIVTIYAEDFAPFVQLENVRFGSEQITFGPATKTDSEGSLSFEVKIPNSNLGTQPIEITVGKTVASVEFTVTSPEVSHGEVVAVGPGLESLDGNLVIVWHFNNRQQSLDLLFPDSSRG